MAIVLKSGGSSNLVNSDGAGSLQVNVKAPVDSASNVLVSTEGRKATYRSTGGNQSVGAISYLLIGSATKKVKLLRAEINCNSTATGLVQVQIVKYSTTPTGGTISVLPAVPNDSSDAAATGIFRGYTVAPTAGTLVGAMGTWVIAFSINSTASISNPVNVFNFAAGAGEKPITLNNANECIAFAFNATVFANVTVVWTEE